MASPLRTIDDVLDELTYRSYREQRLTAPHVAPERWARVYEGVDVAALEARFQRERA